MGETVHFNSEPSTDFDFFEFQERRILYRIKMSTKTTLLVLTLLFAAFICVNCQCGIRWRGCKKRQFPKRTVENREVRDVSQRQSISHSPDAPSLISGGL